jgi:hypothetical protein
MSVRTIDRAAVDAWRPRSGNRLVAPDGSTLTLDHPTAPLTEPWFTESRVRLAASPAGSSVGVRAFETGPVGTVDGHVEILLAGKYVAEYAAQAGTFLLAQNADNSTGLVAWQGRWHEAYCWVNVPNPTHAEMLEAFAGLSFTDTPAGLLVRPRKTEAYQRITANKHIPGVGFAKIAQTARVAQELPTWSGRKVGAGEVWRQRVAADVGGEHPAALVCASPTAVITIDARDGGNEDTALAFLTALGSVTWQ